MIKICNFCGNEYKTKSHTRKFCSHDCYAKHLSANIKGKDHPLWKEKIKKYVHFVAKNILFILKILIRNSVQ